MIKKTYYWKEITGDGLVKDPREFGPYYSTDSLNGYDGHDSEDEAIARLIEIEKSYKYQVPSSLTLVTEYRVVDDV